MIAVPIEIQRQVHEDAEREVCTCECVRGATHLEPAEWEQDPACPTHPDVRWLIALARSVAASAVSGEPTDQTAKEATQ